MSVEPLAYSAADLDAVRVGFALAVLLALDGLRFFPPKGDRLRPVGLGRWLDTAALARPRSWHRVSQVAALLVAAEIANGWAVLVLAVHLVLAVTARSSDGSVNHGDHLVCIVAVAQVAAFGLWDAAERWGWDLGGWLAGSRQATAAWWATEAIVAVYFTSGLAKLLATAGAWIGRSPALLLAATARLEMSSALGARTSATSARLIDALLPRPGLARVAFGAGLLVELAAPLGLLDPGALLAVGVGLLVLHEANRWLLGLPFTGYEVLVVTFLVAPVAR